MTRPQLLSEVRAADLRDKIEALVSNGEVSLIDVADRDVIEECARRYLSQEIGRRARRLARARERFATQRAEADAALRAKVALIVGSIAEVLHDEWSAALLGGTFNLPDGTRVTWAAATIEQHSARAEQLEHLAAGNLQTAALHRRAIRDIQAAHVTSLGEVSR